MASRILVIALLTAGTAAQAGSHALDSLRAFPGAAANVPAAREPAAVPIPSPARADEIMSTTWETMLSGMPDDRRAAMKDRVMFFKVAPGRRVIDEGVSTLETMLPPAEAATAIELLRLSYARRMAPVGGVTPSVPRGFSGMYDFPGGTWVLCFVGEENLAPTGEWDPNGSRMLNILVHELGHAVFYLLSDAERAEMRELAEEYYRQNPEMGAYRSSDDTELFAMATEIWFGVHQLAERKKGLDSTTPFVKLAGTMRFIDRIYGPARNVR